MKTVRHFGGTLTILVAAIASVGRAANETPTTRMPSEDVAGIERLHQQDVKATLSGKADDLVKLWDDKAIRMEPGGPAEVGKKLIYANDKKEEANSKGGQTLYYKPEIKDLQIAGNWAFEWGYFDASYKPSATAKPVALRGKLLRVLKRQPDGSWKFARVMWNTAEQQNGESLGKIHQHQ